MSTFARRCPRKHLGLAYIWIETIERAALLELARPQGLTPFSLQSDAYLIAPLVDTPSGTKALPDSLRDRRFEQQLPETKKYWTKAESIFRGKRSEKAGATLMQNLDWRGKLSKQLNSVGSAQLHTKVVYNKSGRLELRAARCSPSLVVNGSLYWLNAATVSEAHYLCGIINAPCLQEAWRMSKTSRNHFDMNPWRAVPVPRFNRSNNSHMAIVNAAELAEQEAERSPDGWDKSGESATSLNKAVAALLPAYAVHDS